MALYFHTTGAVTAQFPLRAQVGGDSTTTTSTYASSFWTTKCKVRLLAINALTAPASADTITFVDKAGTACMKPISVPTTIATWSGMNFGPLGVQMPVGGFGITTGQASSVYQYVFDVDLIE